MQCHECKAEIACGYVGDEPGTFMCGLCVYKAKKIDPIVGRFMQAEHRLGMLEHVNNTLTKELLEQRERLEKMETTFDEFVMHYMTRRAAENLVASNLEARLAAVEQKYNEFAIGLMEIKAHLRMVANG